MGVPTSEVGYTPAMPRREDHEDHNGHVVVLGEKENIYLLTSLNLTHEQLPDDDIYVSKHFGIIINKEVLVNTVCICLLKII